MTQSERPTATFEPEPEPRLRTYPMISVDDHLVEPPSMFEGRLPSKYKDQGPRVNEDTQGNQFWQIGEQKVAEVGYNSVAGRAQNERNLEPARFDEMRPGTWDIRYRLHDMDLDGVWGSLCFPSSLSGFAGRRYSQLADRDFGLAALRAWNDWHIEEWVGACPERLIPCQLPWYNDAQIAANEIRRNAERGFKAVSFSQAPHELGWPSLYSGYWDPFMKACEETDTVICLHFGTGKAKLSTAQDAPPDAETLLFPFYGAITIADWIFSQIPLRFPNLKIALSECGIGWVPFCLDRLKHMEPRRQNWKSWQSKEVSAAECLHRNFWFCALDEQAGFQLRDRIGVEHILLESDYPHEDSTWPDTQASVEWALQGIPVEEAAMISYKNAAALFRHDTAPLAAWMADTEPQPV